MPIALFLFANDTNIKKNDNVYLFFIRLMLLVLYMIIALAGMSILPPACLRVFFIFFWWVSLGSVGKR